MSATQNTIAAIALAGAMASALTLASSTSSAADDQEKCFGISKAGGNDCAAEGSNSCAGTSKVDYDAKAWKLVKKGTCLSIEVALPGGKTRKGSLEPSNG